VRDNTAEVKQEAREQFLTPMLAHLDESGLGHLSEIADADAPHTPRGCPLQAWSVGELPGSVVCTPLINMNESLAHHDA
jgi:glycogen debranching enzyme